MTAVQEDPAVTPDRLADALRRSVLRRGDDRVATWTAVAGDGLTPDEVLAGTLRVLLREHPAIVDDPDYYPSTEYERGYADGRAALEGSSRE